MAVGMHALLDERCVSEHEMQDRGSTVIRIGGSLRAERIGQRGLRLRRAELERIGAEDQFGAVTVGEECVADARAVVRTSVLP